MYQLAVLPLLPLEYVKRIKNLMVDFLWDGKKSKISWKIVTGLKEDGGAGLFDLKIQDKALKIQWVYKLLKDPVLKAFAYDALCNPLGRLFMVRTNGQVSL